MELKDLVKGYKEELYEIKKIVNEMSSDEDTKIYEDGDDYEEDVVSRPKKVEKNTRQKPRKESRVNNFEDNEDNEDNENKIWLVIGAASFIIGLILLILGNVNDSLLNEIIGGLIMTIGIGAVVYILDDYNWYWKVVSFLLGLILISIGSLVGFGLLITIGVLISVVTLLVIVLSFIIWS